MERMKRKKVYIPLAIFLTVLVLIFIVFFNNFIISTRIYYNVAYRGDVQDLQSLIEKSESFNYEKYCKYRGYSREVENITEGNHSKHIDREYINSLKQEIEEDKEKFHLWPFYKHYFNYSFEATNESLITLTYNNHSVIEAEYADGQKIFRADNNTYSENNSPCLGIWYLNFSHIPYAPNQKSNVSLNNVIMVKMFLEYDHVYGNVGAENFKIEQYLCLDSNLEMLFIYIPLTLVVMG
jgi:hypothetical protein